jgi:cytohesin
MGFLRKWLNRFGRKQDPFAEGLARLRRIADENARAIGVDPATADRAREAVLTNDLRRVEELIGAEPALVKVRDASGDTLLHLAATNSGLGDANRVAHLLIQKGADIHARGVNERTPLHNAAGSRDPEVARMLLEHGADVHAKTSRGHEPVHFAGDPAILDLLLSHGADINARSNDGETPLAVMIRSCARTWVLDMIKQKGGTL